MSVNGKRKGKSGELELARKFREYGYDARRSVQYNGKAEEGQPDLVGVPGIHVECKRTERLNLYDAINQAKRDSEGTGDFPVVFHRRNDCEWLAVMTFGDFMKLYHDYLPGTYYENAERCAACGDIIPEGRQVCPNCERDAILKGE